MWFDYFVICKVRVTANFLRFNICVWRASKLSLLVLGRFNYYCIRHCLRARRPIRPALISGFLSMKRLGVFLLPPGWDASPSQGYPQHFVGTHLYTWVERGTVRVKCLAQEHNTMSLARTRTRNNRSGVERTNHEAIAPPTTAYVSSFIS